jgi:hypothetical protein
MEIKKIKGRWPQWWTTKDGERRDHENRKTSGPQRRRRKYLMSFVLVEDGPPYKYNYVTKNYKLIIIKFSGPILYITSTNIDINNTEFAGHKFWVSDSRHICN